VLAWYCGFLQRRGGDERAVAWACVVLAVASVTVVGACAGGVAGVGSSLVGWMRDCSAASET
jgi:hypothetical protein